MSNTIKLHIFTQIINKFLIIKLFLLLIIILKIYKM